MKTLFAEPKTASQAAYVCRVIERAQNLLNSGYRIQQMGRTPWYAIFKPENDCTRNCDRDYLVDMTPYKEECSCEGFAAGDCKHRIAVQILVDEKRAEEAMWETLCAEHDRREAEAECAGGVDYRL